MAEPSIEEQILGGVCVKLFLQTVMMSFTISLGQHGNYVSYTEVLPITIMVSRVFSLSRLCGKICLDHRSYHVGGGL